MPSFGEELRRERELRQISLREVSEATKINIRYLEALERNDFRHLPGGVFNKGFVRAYSEFIGVDPEAMVNAYLLEEQEQTTPDGQHPPDVMRGNFSGQSGEERSGYRQNSASKTAFIVLAVIVVAILIVLAVWWLRPGERPEPEPVAGEPVDLPAETGELVDDERLPESEPAGPDPESTGEEAAPEPAAPASAAVPAGPVVAVVILDRETRGRVNCDNRQVTILGGRSPGSRFEYECENFLLINADDAGAIRIGTYGGEPVPLGGDGESIRGYRILPPATPAGAADRE